uniref:Putative transmembrane protein n=1 Tax=Serpentovirinae sp. TaxID=2661817 RepID=A0A5P9KAM6_9NIDO|nr:putative transmembrane protein [Serpentovirinae sp.]
MKYLIIYCLLSFVAFVHLVLATSSTTAVTSSVTSTQVPTSALQATTSPALTTSHQAQAFSPTQSELTSTKVHITSKKSQVTTATSKETEFYVTNCQCPNYCQLNGTGVGVADNVKFNSTQSVTFWSTLITLFNPSVICVQLNETCGNKNYATTSACLLNFGVYQPTPSCSEQVRLRTSEVPVCQAVNVTVIKIGRKSSIIRETTIDMSQSISGVVLAGGILISCVITAFIILIIKAMFTSQPNITIKIPKTRFY